VKYPPAIIITAANRFQLSHLRISRAWDGIINAAANSIGGFFIRDIEMSSFNCGLSLDNSLDFGHVSGYHHWNFDSTTSLDTVYYDGNTFAAKFGAGGEVDGLSITDFTCWSSRVSIASSNTWMHFTNLMMDGNNSTLEISGGQWIQISNLYFTGASSGGNSHAQLDVSGGTVIVSNIHATSTKPCVAVSGGSVKVTTGTLGSFATSQSAAVQTGGGLVLSNIDFIRGVGTWTVPVVNCTAGTIIFIGNTFYYDGSGSAAALAVTTDSSGQIVVGNFFGNWSWIPPGEAGFYAYNSDRDIRRAASTTTPTDTTENLLLTPRAGVAGSIAKLRMRGNFPSGGDYSPRVIAELRAGFSALSWGAAYLDFGLSNAANDGSSTAIMPTVMRLTAAGVMGIGFQVGSVSGPTIASGTGAASGTQPKGSLWMRTDGGVGTTMYVSQGGGTWNAVAGV
jgi:hypothetical protein